MRFKTFFQATLVACVLSVTAAEQAHAVLSFPAEQEVSTDWDRAGGNVADFAPRLALSADGTATVAWNQGTVAFPVFARRVAPNGTPGTELQLSDTGDQSFDIGLVTDSDGITTVVWLNDDGVDEPTVVFRRILADGTAEGVVSVELSDDSVGASAPRLAIDDDDRVTVTWERGGDVQAVRIDAAGTPGTIIDVADTAALERNPEVAVDGADRALVVFSRGSSNADLLARRINANGTLESERTIATAGGGTTRDPAVEFDSSNRATVAWEDENASFMSRVQARTLDGAGTLGTVESMGPRTESIDKPSLSIDSSDRARVAWSTRPTFSSTNTDTLFRRLNASGAPVGSLLTVADGYYATSAIDSKDRVIVAYKSESDGRIRARRISPDGVAGPVKVVSDRVSFRDFPIAVGPNDRPAVAYLPESGDQEQRFIRGAVNPPQTTITAGPADGATIAGSTAQFRFTSTADLDGSFECSVDGSPFQACAADISTTVLAPGVHNFQVRALDEDGTDATPASSTFNVPVPDTTLDGPFAKAKGKQKQKGKKVKIEVKVGAAENAEVTITGKVKGGGSFPLKTLFRDVAVGQRKTLKLKLKKSSDAKRVAKRLKAGKKVTASITVKLVDPAGNSNTDKLKVTLKG